MPEASDMELLRDYRRHGSETAFAELVRRHIHIVYSVAARHAGVAAHAEEITQAVFIILARKAAGLRPGTILEGWLHETTRLTALNFLRGERRRQFREQEAYMQSTIQESPEDAVWQQLAPMLDEAIARLGKQDRDAVILRFFKERRVREVAAAMQVSEPAAQRRVLRAVDKLRQFFAERGVNCPADAITGSIAAHSIQIAPAGLAAAVTAAAKGAAASASVLTLVKGALKIMAWTKAKTAAVAGMVLILAAGTTVVAVNYHNHHSYKKLPLTPENKRVFQQQSTKLMNDAKYATLDCMLFASDHTNQLPKSFAQLNASRGQTKLSDADWQIVASGNKDGFTNPDTTIYFLERKPRQSPDGSFAKVYATVNGRVFLLTSPKDDFTAAEKKRGFLVQQTMN